MAARIYVVAFGCVWCVLVLFGLIEAIVHASAAALVPAIMLVFGATLCWKMSRLAVIADEYGLTIRGYWKSERIPKSQIEGFRVGTGGAPFGTCVSVLVNGDRVVNLDVTRRPGRSPFGRKPRSEEQIERLRAWLEGPSGSGPTEHSPKPFA